MRQPERYKQLITLVRQNNPRVIVEIGTWNGHRAKQMLKECPEALYIGFDLFEDGDPGVDKAEFNVKKHHSRKSVADKLAGYQHHLVKGNTRQTLPEFVEHMEKKTGPFVDFAFIDGGHSVETIASDWKWIKRIMRDSGLVVFDDYYSEMPGERIAKFGCNKVLEGQMELNLLPAKDTVAGGGYVQMAIVPMIFAMEGAA